MTKVSEETRRQIVSLVREFVKNDVLPIASQYDNEDTYPHELVPTMRELGLFGITIPEEYGGLGLDHTTMAMIFEELSKGWMSVAGIIGTHHVMASIVGDFGTEEQKERLLPSMASGEHPRRAWSDRAGGRQRRAKYSDDGDPGRGGVRPER